MLSGLERLQKRARVPAQRRITAETAEAGQRARRLVRQLLAVARRETPEPERLSPSEAALGMRDLLQRSVGPSVQLALELAPDTWAVFVEPGGMETVLLNLAVNARDAMPSGGRLLIATRNLSVTADDALRPGVAPGDYVALTIRDNGIGMSPQVRARLFEPFFTTKPRGKGTGLGLAMVNGFVRRSGGYLRLESAPGEGTEFELLLPRAEEGRPVQGRSGGDGQR